MCSPANDKPIIFLQEPAKLELCFTCPWLPLSSRPGLSACR